MPTPDTSKLATVLTDLLAAAADSLTSPPERQYVSAGTPATVASRDACEELTVRCTGIRVVTLAQPGDNVPPRRQPKVRVATCVVRVLIATCPSLDPSVEELNADGLVHATAGYELYAGLLWRHEQKTLLPSLPEPSTLTAQTLANAVAVLDQEGGLAGWDVSIDVTL